MKTNRLKRWIVTVAVMGGLLGSVHAADRPNIVLIIGDDISVDDFGCYGHPTIRTPNVDNLAAKGLRFNNAYLTTSQCSPTRCSLITGRYPHNTGAPELHMPLPEGQVMFPELLKKAGYYTAAAGKWHLGNYAKNAFDRVVGGGAGGEERWLDCLQNRPKDKPFFMWFASYDAHRPWDDKIQAKRHTPQNVVMPPYMVDIPVERADMAQYYDEVQRLDRYAGYVVEELRNQGVLDNTLILFMADNGRPFWRAKTRLYDSGVKTPLVVHWPAGLPKKGQTCDSLVSTIDIAPTLLELAGLKTPDTVQGTSFTALLADPGASMRDYVFAEHNWHAQIAHERMVRHGEYVYIRNAHAQLPQVIALKSSRPHLDELRTMAQAGQLTHAQMDPLLAPRPAEELFKISDDADQLRNLADDPAHGKVLEDLRSIMDQWQRRTGDTTPSLDQATPDRHDRNTGKRLQKKPGMRPVSGVLPGETTGAEGINDPGPIKVRKDTLPNFVVIFCDDLGYGDVGWLGPVKNRTPNIDRMAEQGACFTDFYCTSGVCSPSRASLMTGCYPLRVGMHKSSKGMFVLVPKDQKGLHPDEITVAEVLKPNGYRTACIGKWHLGDQPEFLPTRQGFDYYYGLPF
ncbi:MAG: sulfatase-like hydrolase/transferase, partial [Planctomycetes bacterium]|nr:sulfatase-like hydrolase/transferase [Planctomycetota bacterium]